jgi:hypothetical protein
MNTLITSIKIALLFIGSFLYLLNSFRIGFKITGDMHSGGPFVGPLLLAVTTFLLFINRPKIRKASGYGLLIYIGLAMITISFLT